MLTSCYNQQAEPNDTPSSQSSVESPQAFTGEAENISQANPSQATSQETAEELFYAKGPRRQNWRSMFPLKGDVAKVVIRESWNGEGTLKYGGFDVYDEYHFNKKGDVVYWKGVGAPQDAPENVMGGPRSESIYTYNRAGKLIEKVKLNNPHMWYAQITITNYEYSPEGQLIKAEVYNRGGDECSGDLVYLTTYYNGDEEFPVHKDGPVPVETYIKNGAETIAQILSAGYKNKVVKKTIYDTEGEVSGRVIISFDSHGNVIKYVANNDPTQDDYEYSYIYKLNITYRK